MRANFSVESAWLSKAAAAISTRDGVPLKECLVAAVAGTPAVLLSDDDGAVGGLVDSLYQSLEALVCQQASPLPPGQTGTSLAAQYVEKERHHLIETVARATVTGALAKYQEMNRVVFRVDASEMGMEEPQDDELVRRTVQNTLLRGLLYAFEAFQEVHCMNREHYPPRRGTKTKGTVGWDTLVLLYFVHHIPQIAREASGSVVDEATGEVVRQWRRLLIAVQSADGHEAPEHSRRRGTLSIVNGLLMILFSRYNTHQCNVLLNAVDYAEKGAVRDPSKSILQPSQHMTSEVLTYYYFKGRLALYGHRFEEAHSSLRQAYRLLPPFDVATPPQCKNKLRVRFYLCIAALINNRSIPDSILNEDDLLAPIMLPLIGAIRRGDPVAFHVALERFGSTFRRRGVYLLLQQCQHLCSLMLLCRVHDIIAYAGADNSRVPFAALVEAQKWIIEEERPVSVSPSPAQRKEHEDFIALHRPTTEKVALSLSHLIAKGYIRGYLSYEHHTLVLSKTLPFPIFQQ